ncbi:MAG: RES family NAD+ phosphorylase [Gemmatimonadaceae bacterium]
MRRADASDTHDLTLWRAVEAQHVVSTMMLVDTLAEQRQLEELLEGAKPRLPPGTSPLHYLLSTPFRYPSPLGSRFRAPADPGVLYGADERRTACAELGYWRWRFLLDSPDLDLLDSAPQTVFLLLARGRTIDLREPPLAERRAEWSDPSSYASCQAFGVRAREEGVEIVRYESVRDPEHGGCGAVLHPQAIARPAPLAQETWYLLVTRKRVRWWQADWNRGPGAWDFDAALWHSEQPAPAR